MLTRRGLVQGAVGATALVALGGASRAFGLPTDALRPPGAQDDERFWGSCIRCDRCRGVCPTRAIGVAKLEDGVTAARAPKMEFRLGYCDTCDGAYHCIASCPTGALKSFDPSVDKLGMAVIDQGKCETYGLSASCDTECIDVCSAEALSLDDGGRLIVDEGACWGCGACEYVCPANAYRAYDGSTGRGINIEPWKGGC